MGKPGNPQGKRQRKYTTTPEQGSLIRREAAKRGVPEHVVFREVVDEGFESHFSEHRPEGAPAVQDELERLALEVAATRKSVRAGTKAELARASWASYAAFGMLRAALRALGADPDDESLPSRAMSRFMSVTDCSVPTSIWESAGRRMADGDSYHDAIVAACREHAVAWEDFSGARPKRSRDAESAPRRKGGAGNGNRKGQGRKR